MALTAQLNGAQQRLLNVIHRNRELRADKALEILPGYGPDVVDDLARTGHIVARTAMGRDDDIRATPTSSWKTLYLQLTPRGNVWVVTDPWNRLLAQVVERRPMSLADADAADEQMVRQAWDDGYVTLHYAGDLRETKFSGDGRYEFRHARDFVLMATSKARHALGLT
jgi:hypothetical protein